MTIGVKALALNPDTVIPAQSKWIRDLAGSILDQMIALWPEYPANGFYYTLTGDLRGVNIALNLSDKTAVRMTIVESRGQKLIIAMIKAPEIPKDDGMPTMMGQSYERMTLRADEPSDIQGWLFVAKTFYDNHLCPPHKYTADQGLEFKDDRTGRLYVVPAFSPFEIHPTYKGLRLSRQSNPKASGLEHPSWVHLEREYLQAILLRKDVWPEKRVPRVTRYRVTKRVAFFCAVRNVGVNFKRGILVDVLTDNTAIRMSTHDSSTNPTSTDWVQIRDGERELEESIQDGTLRPTLQEPSAPVVPLDAIDDILRGLK